MISMILALVIKVKDINFILIPNNQYYKMYNYIIKSAILLNILPNKFLNR